MTLRDPTPKSLLRELIKGPRFRGGGCASRISLLEMATATYRVSLLPPPPPPFHSPRGSQWEFPKIQIRSYHSVRHLGHKIEGHSLQVVQVQGTHLPWVPVLSLTCSDPPLASHGSGNKRQAPYHPAPATSPTSPLLSSPTGCSPSLGQVKRAPPQGLCSCSSLNLEESFPRFCTMGLFSSGKSWHTCHLLGEAALTAYLRWCPIGGTLCIL